MKRTFLTLICVLLVTASLVGCIEAAEPHIPVINTPRIIIAEQTWENNEGQTMADGKIFIPLAFDGEPLLHDIKSELPVITFYQFDMASLDGYVNTPQHSVVFNDTPESVMYTLFDEDFGIMNTTETFVFPTEIGDYILQINAFDTAYFARIVVGEPRGWCDRIDRHHGGGEGLLVYDFNTLSEIRDLLSGDDKAVADYFKAICDRGEGSRWECPCFIQTKADLQSFFSWLKLDQVRLPFSDTIKLRTIVLRDRYADIYVSYRLDDMLFNFSLAPGLFWTAEGVFDYWVNANVQNTPSLLTTTGDVNIYMYGDDVKNPQVRFILSVNGMYVKVSVSIDCANPDSCDKGEDFGGGHSCYGEWVDRQTAIDGILQFDFRTPF